MSNIFTKKKMINLLIYVSIFIVFAIVLKPVKPYYGDDIINMGILNNKSYFQWLIELYTRWSGRIILTSLLVLLLNLPLIIWRFLNAFFLTLLVISIIKITRLKSYYMYFVLFLILYFPINVLNSSSFWITGSLNYLWPISSSFYLIYVLREFYDRKNINNFQFVLSILFCIIGSNNEQTGIVLISFYTIILILIFKESRRLNRKILTLYLLMWVGFLVLMLAPGNFNRFNVEMLGIMPNFRMLTFYDKLLYGINFTSKILFYDFKYYLLLMVTLINILGLKSKRREFIFTLVPLFIISLKVVFDVYIRINPYCRSCNDLHYILFNFRYFSVSNFTEWIHLIPVIIVIVFLVSVIISTISVIKNNKNLIFYLLAFLASFLSSIILGFSPTIDASGNRIYFLMLSLILLFIVLLFENLKIKENKFFSLTANLFALILVVRIAYNLSNIVEFIVLY